MSATQAAARPDPRALSQQIQLRLRRERNRRLLRGVLVLVVVTGLLIVLAITNRDRQAIRHSHRVGIRLTRAFQAEFDRTGIAPRRLPPVNLRARHIRDAVIFNVYYPDQIRTARVVGVCCNRSPVSMYLDPPGRHVVLFDGREFQLEWMLETEFRERAYALGFASLPGAATN